RPPRLLRRVPVPFWGWATGLLPPAISVAAVLEGASAVPWRVDFSRRDFNRVSDLCAILFAGSAVYLFTAVGGMRVVDGPRAITVLFQWLPLLAAPLVACQAYSTAGTVDLSVFFWTRRKKAADQPGASSGACKSTCVDHSHGSQSCAVFFCDQTP